MKTFSLISIKISFFIMFTTYSVYTLAQTKFNSNSKRIINRIGIYFGPSTCFNFGSKFVENFKDENVINKRLAKTGYSIGIDLGRDITKRLDLEVKAQYDSKGSKTELDTPESGVYRLIYLTDYDYTYWSLAIAPRILMGQNRRIAISIGFYYSWLESLKSYSEQYSSRDDLTTSGEFDGRYYYDLGGDGVIEGFTWAPGITGIERNDSGVTASFEYKIPIKGNQNLFVQANAFYGLKNINRNNPYNYKEHNGLIGLVLGYRVEFKN